MRGRSWFKSRNEFESPRTKNTGVWGQGKMDVSVQAEGIHRSSAFFFYSGPPRIEWCPPTLRRPICFAQLTNSNANLTLIDTPRNNVSPAPWASVSLVKLTHSMNHHSHVLCFRTKTSPYSRDSITEPTTQWKNLSIISLRVCEMNYIQHSNVWKSRSASVPWESTLLLQQSGWTLPVHWRRRNN